MNTREIHLSPEFKAQATKAILAISVFIATYLIILVFAVLLTALCIAAGISLIAFKPMLATIALGIGLASLGVLILIFLLKFIFKSHKIDRSHLTEIKEHQEPELFKMLREIVQDVGTNFPKKVYLSSEVNASVFYDSSFWSMFLPVKKNLLIGLGLVNTVTKQELKAILSHEFGHFSQRTMKVGSYVYNVNQVIFNILFENDSYENLVQRWANVSGYFSIFVVIAGKINEGIQWILRKLYNVVNKNYLGLSREMEFHADEIAASVTGYEPLKKSLLRMALADNSLDNVLNFYNGKISDNIKSDNLYRDQSCVLNFLAESNSLIITNGLPDISLEEQSKYDKSKLVIKNQWASHPTIDERIDRLEKTGFSTADNSDSSANNVFSDIDQLQKQITSKLFETVSYQGETTVITSDIFFEEYKKEALSNSFSKTYNGYYNSKNPVTFDLNLSQPHNDKITLDELFSDKKVDLVYSAIALQNDIQTLNSISNKELAVKTFDYDGVKYDRKNAGKLLEELKPELDRLNELIKWNDCAIYEFFIEEEKQQGKPKELEQLYRDFFEFDKVFDSKYELYTGLLTELQFVNVTTPFEQITTNFSKIKPTEELLKKEINLLLSEAVLQTELPFEVKEKLEQYTSKTHEYFGVTSYFDNNLNMLFVALHNYGYLLSRKYFLMKKNILAYQEELIKEYAQSVVYSG
ncbi:M48 family metalloprotease [Maribellus sp. CM-23]|uniref:M48 family metalloprotease n=1 Tax=Maribellus sp. CM-23 TaxID=2781026 RepID=UPI001F21ECA8|nr:M48 family metallopeptidase [Maribellus sp. CM-23]MCE4565172.1 M48 family metalloprotease [Maribellus sp. CM-23]